MKNLKIIMALLLSVSVQAYAGGVEDDPILIKVMGEVETRKASGADPKVWNIDAWIGKDLEKLWIKSEGEKLDGKTTEAELQMLYSKAISPFLGSTIWNKERLQADTKQNLGYYCC